MQEVCQETKRRIKLAVCAYAYEVKNVTIISDHEYDAECLKINLYACTSRPDLDWWFYNNFDPSTGVWVRNHPELNGIINIYRRYYEVKYDPNATFWYLDLKTRIKHYRLDT